MSDSRSELFDEYSELNKRIENLKASIISDDCDSLPEIDRLDLKEQLKHMKSYFKVLYRRVSRQCNNA